MLNIIANFASFYRRFQTLLRNIFRIQSNFSFYSDQNASVIYMAALSLPAMITFGAFAVDFNNVHEQRIRDQMVADAAAQSAAMAYFQSGQTTSVLLPTAQDIAVANGLQSSAISTAQSVLSPTGSGNAVQVTVTTTVPFTLGKLAKCLIRKFINSDNVLRFCA